MKIADDGCGLAEAIVALAIAAVAFGGIAAATQVATVAVRRAAARQAATAAASERLEVLRATSVASGADVVPGEPPVERAWQRTTGRGRPDHVAARAECDGARVTLDTAVWP